MKDKLDLVKHNSLYRSTATGAVAQLLSVCICTAILFLFVALTYSEITLPRYTTQYAQKDTQQLINLIVAVVAVVIGIWLSHCRRLTNEAETRSELRNEKLTIPRLHVHFEAAGGSKTAMGKPAIRNRAVWKLVAIYFFAMIMFGFLNSVLSVIFVIESIISSQGEQEPAYIPIGVDIPLDVDPCSTSLYEPGCSYALGLQALSSQLVTYQPYTIAGVTFEPPNGTLGMPYYAMKHFSDEVQSSSFEEEHRQYCLPVLDPHIIKCTELPFDQFHSETTTGNYLRYHALNVTQVNYSGGNDTVETLKSLGGLGVYKTVVNFPSTHSTHINYRVDDQGQGTMLVKMNPDYSLPDDPPMWTLVAATDYDAYNYGHASNLYKLMYGHYPDLKFLDKLPEYSRYFTFVAKCEYTDIQYRDNYLSSWRKVDFSLKNGVSRANVTDERCPNSKGSWTSGFDDLRYAIVGATTVLSSTDGYSPLFNLFEPKGSGTPYFANMSRLDAIVNSLYHITSTFWTAQSHEQAMKNQSVYDHPIMMTKYPHLYVIRIDWTPATYIGLVLSIFICLSAWMLGIRWLLATYNFGFEAETWNLLQPIDLMAYSLAAYKDLVHDLNTKEHRRSTMRGKTGSILHAHPVGQGTQDLIGLVEEKIGSDTSTSSPVEDSRNKFGPSLGPQVTVDETSRRSSDLESGR